MLNAHGVNAVENVLLFLGLSDVGQRFGVLSVERLQDVMFPARFIVQKILVSWCSVL